MNENELLYGRITFGTMAPTKERPKSTSTSIRKQANERKFECGKCKSVVENVICCERCVQWLCMECADIKTEAKFNFFYRRMT